MNKFRIGNDITIRWRIKKNGNDLSLPGKIVRLFLTHSRGREEVSDFQVIDSTVTFVLKGEQQTVLGYYTLTIDVRNEENQRFLIQDKCKAFELVGRSCAEDSDNYNVHL